jgi:hypothetical protein
LVERPVERPFVLVLNARLTRRETLRDAAGMSDRWLTYVEAGKLLGMSAEAARQRARRLR